MAEPPNIHYKLVPSIPSRGLFPDHSHVLLKERPKCEDQQDVGMGHYGRGEGSRIAMWLMDVTTINQGLDLIWEDLSLLDLFGRTHNLVSEAKRSIYGSHHYRWNAIGVHI